MKANRDLDELLISFLLKELTAEEEAFVIEHLNRDEKNRQHFEVLQDTWKLLAINQELCQVDTNSEWKHFEQRIAGEKQQLFLKKNEAGLGNVEEKMGETTKSIPNERKLFIAIAIAASVLTLIVFGWDYLAGKQENNYPVARAKESSPQPFATVLKHEINTSGASRTLILQDGSEIMLADKSEVSYPEPFTGNRRDITLKGRAGFKVAKDKTRPFTVYSLDLATTALGTRFTVSAFEHSNNIIVRLSEGKVVVKANGSVKAKLKSDYYLQPGEELIYNRKNYTAKLFNFRSKEQGLKNNITKEIFKDNPLLPENSKGSWYMFNNQSLEQVFDQLNVLYNTDIEYSKREVYNIYFIGKFEKTDSLYTILNQIASLNNFKVTRRGNRFIITR